MAVQIKEAVLQCGTDSEDCLADDELAGLLQCLPTVEDVQRLRAAPKDTAQLGEAEQFMLAMMSIPQVGLRPFSCIPSILALASSSKCLHQLFRCGSQRMEGALGAPSRCRSPLLLPSQQFVLWMEAGAPLSAGSVSTL